MDNEFARMIKYIVQGIAVSDGTLAVDVIHEIGVGKNFLSHDHTFKHMRSQSQPKLIDRRTREDWDAGGRTDLYQRALEEARYILENHKPEPLPADVLAAMRSIVEEAEAELGLGKK
jgi:trimethylamine--corrinoid protein Co-methyltransferase